jgi:hypothetical protein
VCNPAIREVNDNVLVLGSLFVVEFAGVDGHGKLWVQMLQSDASDVKASLRGRTYYTILVVGDYGGRCVRA